MALLKSRSTSKLQPYVPLGYPYVVLIASAPRRSRGKLGRSNCGKDADNPGDGRPHGVLRETVNEKIERHQERLRVETRDSTCTVYS